MKTYLILLITLCTTLIMKAQNLSFSQLNSANVVEYYSRLERSGLTSEVQSRSLTAQIGSGNVLEAKDRSPQFLQLTQAGNFNTVYFNNQNNFPTHTEVNIRGSGNYIDITGSNSISEGMKLNINANDLTIFIRNY